MPKISERNFCDGFEMNFTSPLGGIQQAGAHETGAKRVTPFYLGLVTASTQI